VLEGRLARDAEELPDLARQFDRRFPGEPYRRRLGAMAERLRRTRARLTGHVAPLTGAYPSAVAFLAEIDELQAALVAERPHRGADAVLDVLSLADLAGSRTIPAAATADLAPGHPKLDLVPLLESADALGGAQAVLAELFGDPTYRRHLETRHNRQEVMLGYS